MVSSLQQLCTSQKPVKTAAGKLIAPEEAKEAKHLHRSQCAEQSSSLSASGQLEPAVAWLHIPTHRNEHHIITMP